MKYKVFPYAEPENFFTFECESIEDADGIAFREVKKRGWDKKWPIIMDSAEGRLNAEIGPLPPFPKLENLTEEDWERERERERERDNSSSNSVNLKGILHFCKGIIGFCWGEKRPFAYGVLEKKDGREIVTVHAEVKR